jgi:peptide/nickel transport system permease protein
MLPLLIRRGAFSLFSLLVVSAVLFLLTRSIPDPPALIVLGPEATESQVARFNHDYGLDQPIMLQYGTWLTGLVLHGDFGRSFITRRSVDGQITHTMPVTIEMVVIAFLAACILSLILGTLAALLRNSVVDYAARLIAVLGVSVPGFWLALMLILAFAVDRDWFPPGGLVPLSAGLGAHLNSIALPVFCLAVFYMAVLTRMTRSSLLEVLGQDFVRTARATGLSGSRVLFYALKNALVPVVTVAGLSFGHMFGLALIIEQVFNIDGLSRTLLNAIQQRDFVLVQAIVMVFTLVFVFSNLAADLANGWLNPRLAMVNR